VLFSGAVIKIHYKIFIKYSKSFDFRSTFKFVPFVFDPYKYQGTDFILEILSMCTYGPLVPLLHFGLLLFRIWHPAKQKIKIYYL